MRLSSCGPSLWKEVRASFLFSFRPLKYLLPPSCRTRALNSRLGSQEGVFHFSLPAARTVRLGLLMLRIRLFNSRFFLEGRRCPFFLNQPGRIEVNFSDPIPWTRGRISTLGFFLSFSLFFLFLSVSGEHVGSFAARRVKSSSQSSFWRRHVPSVKGLLETTFFPFFPPRRSVILFASPFP